MVVRVDVAMKNYRTANTMPLMNQMCVMRDAEHNYLIICWATNACNSTSVQQKAKCRIVNWFGFGCVVLCYVLCWGVLC